MPETLETKSPTTVETTLQPKYQVLAAQLRRQISEGNLVAGDQLPTFAEIGSTHRVTLTTVKRVYDLLEKEGLIERQRGRGTFVAERKRVLTGNVGLIGINVVRYQQSQFFNYILRGIEEYTSQNGQHLLFASDCTDLNNRELSEKMDGFLFYGTEFLQNREKPSLPQLPRVSMITKAEGVSNVVADDYEGTKAAVRYLMEFGHRRIACLMERHLFVAYQRYAGYRDALSESRVEIRPEWARLTEIVNSGPNPPTYLEWGKSNMRQWLREGWLETGCTAIIAQNDNAAIGVMQALHAEDIAVPNQVSVLGFDGTELCDHTIPPLTSMKMPLTEIGHTAAQILHEQIRGSHTEIRTIMLPMTLRAGGSVAAAR